MLARERGVDANHRDLEQVARGPRERRIGRRALAEGANTEIAVAQLRDVAPAPEERLDEAARARLFDRLFQPGAHTGKALEILFDESLRLLERDPELARQRQCALPVNRREVDRLRAGARLSRDARLRNAEDQGGGRAGGVAGAPRRGARRRA